MRILFVSFLVFAAFLLNSCSPMQSEILLAEFGENQITLDEYEKAYAKSIGSVEIAASDSLQNKKDFLDLYVNFRMKLRDAQVRGFDEDEILQKELEDYRKQIGETYLLEKYLYGPRVAELYEKRKKEWRLSTISISAKRYTPEVAESIADSLITRIQNGESFEELVQQYSDDNFSKQKNGDIYYFTAGDVPTDFLKIFDSTKVGDIYPKPVRSSAGFHVIKVTDIRDRKFAIHARHIMVNIKRGAGFLDTAEAYEKVKMIYDRLMDGEDFAELAIEYSDDKVSAKDGGDLGYFPRRTMVPEFDYVAFNLEEGEISQPLKTKFGYHIIQLLKVQDYPTFEEYQKDLRDIYKRQYFRTDYYNMINSFKEDVGYKFNQSVFDLVINKDDTTTVKDYPNCAWRDEVKDSVIFSIGENNYVVDSVLIAFKDDYRLNIGVVDKLYFEELIKRYSSDFIFKKTLQILDFKDEEFAELMEDYKNGIYIFKLQEEEIWGNIESDTSALLNYFEANKENYRWPERAKFREIYSKSDSVINLCYSMLLNGDDFAEVASKYTERAKYQEKGGEWSPMAKGVNLVADAAFDLKEPGKFSQPQKYGNGWIIVKLEKIIPPGLKTFDEAKAEVTSRYQEEERIKLENQYINRLKKVYNPTIYYENLNEAFKPDKK